MITTIDLNQTLQRLQNKTPKMILTNYHLNHGVLGCQMIQQLRDEFANSIPTLIISTDHNNTYRRELQTLGTPLLNKPIKPSKLHIVTGKQIGRAHV